jgi:hypothetical protein
MELPVSAPIPDVTHTRAPVLRRTAAWAVDWVIVMVPGALLLIAAATSVVHALPGYLGSVAAGVGWSRLATTILHHGHGAAGVGDKASEEWFSLVLPLVAALLAVPLLQFAYHGGLLAWRGRTFGSIVADMRVDAMATPARPHALRRAFLTVLVESGLLSLALAALTVGQFTVAAVFGALALAAFWLNVLMLLGSHGRTMVDRLTGTAMVRTALNAASVATPPREAGQAARLTVDAAAVAGQLARERAEAIARSASVQQALNSRGGQRVRAFGGRASGSARRLGGRAQEIWEQRQSERRLPPDGQPRG